MKWIVWVICSVSLLGAEWPSFRGPNGTGIAEATANPPVHWDIDQGTNLKWRVPLPGLGHSSPVVWGQRVFLTSGVTHIEEPYLRVGLYGDSPDNPEDYEHRFNLYCYDLASGALVWQRTAHRGVPQVRRHVKSSHSNASVVTDGRHVVAFFGSEGLYCYDLDGELVWHKDLGLLDSGAFNMPEIQWGFGSSPRIHGEKVIVLCDVNNQSFLTALSIEDGREIWRTPRDEGPTWGTPSFHEGESGTQIVVNGYHHIGGYAMQDGKAIWSMRGGGDVPVPTPVIASGMAFITNAHGPMNPIYAVDLRAKGDVSLKSDQTKGEFVAWSLPRRGAYMPTPIVVDGLLYVINDRGILTCYEANTGEQVYRTRVYGRGEAYTASPVSAAGRIYFTSEDGDIHVVKAGRQFERLASNQVGGVCLATPAIAGDMLLVRTSRDLIGFARGVKVEPLAKPETQPDKQPQTEPFIAIDADGLTDPIEIMKRCDARLRQIDAASYRIRVKARGRLTERIGGLEATVRGRGYADRLPQQFEFDAQVFSPRGGPGLTVKAGSDGNRYYVLDPNHKTAHVDLDPRILGRFGRYVMGGMMVEFHHPQPMADEIKGKLELLSDATVEGEPCWRVKVAYDNAYAPEAIWYISKRDFLPRARFDFAERGGDEMNGLMKTLLELDLKDSDQSFGFELPPGFEVSEEPPRAE